MDCHHLNFGRGPCCGDQRVCGLAGCGLICEVPPTVHTVSFFLYDTHLSAQNLWDISDQIDCDRGR